MNNKDFKATLRRALQQDDIPRDKKHFEQTLMLAQKEACHIQKRKRITFSRFLILQIKHIGWKIWTAQLFFLSAAHILLSNLYREEDPRHISSLLFCLSVFVLMTALPFIYRSVRYQMQEVESAARFSSVKLLAAKLAMIGIGDLIILGGIFFVTLWETSLPADSIFVSLCFPFLLACSGCLFMLGHLSARHFFAGSVGLCSFLILLSAVLFRHYEAMLRYAFSGRWIVVCALLFTICIRECRYIIYCSPYTEMQLT